MAGLHGLKILLLWAGLLGLSRCATLPPSTSLASTSRNTSQAMGQPPVATNAPDLSTSTSQASITNQVQALPTSDSTNQALHSPTTHNPTSPASIPPFTTSVPGNQTSPCTYSVEPIKYGFQVNISSSIPGKYDVQFTDSSSKKTKNKTLLHELPVKTTVQNNSSKPVFSSTHPIKSFKPCTNYSVTMTGGIVTCSLTGEGTKQTKEMDKGHIMSNTTVEPGCLCYMSDWDLKDAITVSPECHTDSESLTPCIKLRAEHFCSTLNTSFSQACTDPFTNTTNLTWDLFEKSYIDIQIKDNNSLPLELVWGNMPKQCDGILNLTYFSCQSRSDKKDVNITDLQPFTDYDCNGRLKHNHTTIKNITFPVRVNCRLTMTIDRSDVLTFNNSIKLIWTSPPSNCRREDISFNYTCCCRESPKEACSESSTGSESDRQCKVSDLKPFTEYTCDIEAVHESRSINKTTISNIKTEAGTPHMVTITTFSWQGNNAFKVKCEQNGDWNGPMQRYIAEFNGIETKKDTCEFEFKDLSYSTSYQLKVIAFNGKHRSEPTEKTINTSYNDRAVIGILSFFITLTSVALLFVLYKICILKRKKHYREDDPGMKLIARSDEENLMNVEPIGAEVLLDAYKRKIADEGRLFLAEFQSIPRIFSSYTVKEAKRTSNQLKNRYVDILPYDYNRVQLTTGNGDTGSDYINASFIDGFKESNKYIAAQGPKDETVSDFWRMVWEQQSSIIVMVTRCEEGNRVKCTQYWPSPVREVEIFEEFVVKLNDEHHCPDYIIRRLSLTNKKDKNSDREVTHIQFTSWPDHGVPDESHLLLKLRRRVNAFKNLFSGPIVIHCSAGVGRTGSYISIDAMMEGLESEGRVDIYGYVVRLRRQRCLMVQVEAQYILIHQALIEYNQFGETEISLAELHTRLGTLKQRDTDNEPTLLEAEFQRLPRYKSWRTFSVGITEENKKKNRNSSIVPYDYNRVLVKVEDEFSRDSDREEDEEDESSDEEDEEATKYINASYIDGYWCPQSLMAAQGPLPTTTTDFWKMVHQKKVRTIVMLSECTESGQEFCSAYWGEETMTFGDVEVEVTGTETSGAYIVRSMQISHAKRKDKRQVKQYHFLKWADRELPEKPQDLTDMIKNIKQTCGYDNSMNGRSIPIVVHCHDGSSRTGVFCALWNILDSAETEKLFDVFQVTKALRKQRQNMIGSLEQYQFLYDALEGAFPVQNGEVKQATEVASVEIVNEKTGQAAEKQPGQAGGSTGSDQQEAAESDPLVADSEKEAGDAETEGGAKEPASEKSPLEGTNNGPTVTV